ncbi:MAG: ABC transporter ATP-binding protein [Pseudomonadota bacterium]
MSEVLSLSGVEKVYNPGKTSAVEVLRGADLSLRPGEIVGLIAPSGSGKSTLLHIAGLLDRPTGGVLKVNGQDATKLSARARTVIRRDSIGFVYQFHHLLPEFSASENIALPHRAAGASAAAAKARAGELLEAVGLGPRAAHRPAELSGGEAQRVALCRALVNAPDLLLADEPTGNLDPGTSDQVFSVLMDLARGAGLAALIATHNLELAGRMDRVVRLENGRIESV